MSLHPIAHWCLYGDTGSGKSTSFATWPKPMLVFFFDPFGKDTPYLKVGTPSELDYFDTGGGVWTPFREVHSRKKGSLLIRLEYYHETDPVKPTAYSRFQKRMIGFQEEYGEWATCGIDSLTFMELVVRKREQYVMNPMPSGRTVAGKGEAFDIRKWWAGSTDQMEEMLMLRFGSLPMNVVILAHVDEQRDEHIGSFVRNPSLPGRMRKNIGPGYSEMYRQYAFRNEDGEVEYAWQTRPSAQFAASSQIGAPDPCVPHYQGLWTPE